MRGANQTRPTRVTIDVKPGDTPTIVEREREGSLPVAILSTAEFDALTVDPSTVRVGPTGTEAEAARFMKSDVNDDERLDLMMLVRVRDLKIICDARRRTSYARRNHRRRCITSSMA